MTNTKKPVERLYKVQHWKSHSVDLSPDELSQLLKKFIIARLNPEITEAKEKHPWLIDSLKVENVRKDGFHLELFESDRPYNTEEIVVIPYNPELQKVYEASEAIMTEWRKDPVDEGW